MRGDVFARSRVGKTGKGSCGGTSCAGAKNWRGKKSLPTGAPFPHNMVQKRACHFWCRLDLFFVSGSDQIEKKKWGCDIACAQPAQLVHTLEKQTVWQHIIAKSEQIERKSANPVRAGDQFSYHNNVGICSFAEWRMAPQGASFLLWKFVPIWSTTLEASFASGKKNSSVKLLSWCFLAIIHFITKVRGLLNLCLRDRSYVMSLKGKIVRPTVVNNCLY